MKNNITAKDVLRSIQFENSEETTNNYETVKRGEIYLADLSDVGLSVELGKRPVVIIQNNIGNKYSPNVIVSPMTTKSKRENFPTQQKINLKEESVITYEQIFTIDKSKLLSFLKKMNVNQIDEMNNYIATSLGIDHLTVGGLKDYCLNRITTHKNRNSESCTEYVFDIRTLKGSYTSIIRSIDMIAFIGPCEPEELNDFEFIETKINSILGVSLLLKHIKED